MASDTARIAWFVPGIISSGSIEPSGKSSPATASRAQKTPRSRRLASIGLIDGSADHLTSVTSLKIGRYIATTMPPTTTPRNTIIIGSSREVRAVTAESTSSS